MGKGEEQLSAIPGAADGVESNVKANVAEYGSESLHRFYIVDGSYTIMSLYNFYTLL